VTSHLHLVAPPGEVPAGPRRRRKGAPSAALSLTDEEVRALRSATRGIVRARYGTLAKLAAALGMAPGVLTRKKRPSPGLAVALWRLTGIPVEALMRPTLAAVPAPAPAGGGAA
jgi:hypothetical protein